MGIEFAFAKCRCGMTQWVFAVRAILVGRTRRMP